MKDYNMYTKIQQLKEKGFKQSNVANQLKIHRKTVKKYWNMTADEFEGQLYSINRTKLLSEYENTIVRWLSEHPTTSAAQVCDWLKEYYQADFTERTVSRYVNGLRKDYALKKTAGAREYEAVSELPPGQQMQVDFGEKVLESISGGRVRVRVAVFLLSHSRYKYMVFQDRPFTSADFVRDCMASFRYFGGMPVEMVIDQDSILTVSENYGDIIHTYEFEKMRQECKLSIYLCRKADPESKGKVENAVKYVKGNFLENRLYVDEAILNEAGLAWLERTANAKIHGTTKRIPKEVFMEESEHLRPLMDVEMNLLPTICRMVRKDNTIIYDSNRYSVPTGTYSTNPEVRIEVTDGTLAISTVFGDFLCAHQVSMGRGLLIKNTDHSRKKDESVDALQASLDEKLLYEVSDFLATLRKEKSRYARDQFRLIYALCERYDVEKTLNAIDFCKTSSLYGATYVKDFLEHYEKPIPETKKTSIPVSNSKYHVTTQKRSLDVYAKAGEVN